MLDIKVKCAWCSLVLREGIEPISHGICLNCSKQYFGSDEQLDFLHTLHPEVADDQPEETQ